VESKDSFEKDDIARFDFFPLFSTGMSNKTIHRDFSIFLLHKFLQNFVAEIEIQRIRMIEIITGYFLRGNTRNLNSTPYNKKDLPSFIKRI